MKKRVISLVTALILAASALSMTGCVKVVKIGEEGKLTGDVEFNAGDNVANIWDSKALPELEGKAVDITRFLEESGGDLKSLVDKYGKYSMGTSGEINYVVKAAAPETLQGRTIEFTGTFTANKDDEILITPVKLTVN